MKKLFLIPVFAALFSFGGAAHAEVDQSNPQA
ncbi:ABC transporter substrate-binding protein, partial [Burkholderia pseudomallei]|nr:ABC transporter substrate-binding protein [Burkholderia pseudomallei]